MQKLLVIKNDSNYHTKLLEVLAELGVVFDEISPLTRFKVSRYGAIIISGGALPKSQWKEIFKWYKRLFKRIKIPILGICLGHKLMCQACGGIMSRRSAEKGRVKVVFEKCHPLLPNLKELWVYEDHDWSVRTIPDCLIPYGISESGAIQALIHQNDLFYSVQWHPEMFAKNGGLIILQRFIELIE